MHLLHVRGLEADATRLLRSHEWLASLSLLDALLALQVEITQVASGCVLTTMARSSGLQVSEIMQEHAVDGLSKPLAGESSHFKA